MVSMVHDATAMRFMGLEWESIALSKIWTGNLSLIVINCYRQWLTAKHSLSSDRQPISDHAGSGLRVRHELTGKYQYQTSIFVLLYFRITVLQILGGPRLFDVYEVLNKSSCTSGMSWLINTQSTFKLQAEYLEKCRISLHIVSKEEQPFWFRPLVVHARPVCAVFEFWVPFPCFG